MGVWGIRSFVRSGLSATKGTSSDGRNGWNLLRSYKLAEDPSPASGAIRWSSIHSFKGLESPAVVLTEIEPSDKVALSTLLYVGCSRARVHLTVICSPQCDGLVVSR